VTRRLVLGLLALLLAAAPAGAQVVVSPSSVLQGDRLCLDLTNQDAGVARASASIVTFDNCSTGSAGLLLGNGVGATKVTNGTFTGAATGWTLGAAWAYNANAVDKNADGTTLLEQDVSAAANDLYLVTYTVSNWTVGSVTVAVGGASGTARSANGTYLETLKATGTGNLTFTPTNTARFTIDTVSVQKVGVAPADSVALWVTDEGGVAGRAALHLRGENGTIISLGGQGLLLPDGTAAAPSLTFMNETNTGWFRNGAGDIQVVLGGAQWIRLLSGLGVVFNQTLGFASDNANNIGSVGANRPANIYAATAVSAPKFTTTGTGTYAFTLGNTETVGSLNTRVTFKSPGAGVHAFHFANTAFTATSSFSDVLYTDPLIQPGSGSGSFAALHLNPTINGTSTGIAYGLGIASLTNTLTGGSIKPFSVGTTTTDLFTGYTPLIEIDITGYIEGKEQTAPAAPAANGYRLFAQDNGAGKTQLMVIFGSGVAQQIAIEP